MHPRLVSRLAGPALLLPLLALCPSPPASADEGMWTLTDFPTARLQKKYGFAPSAEWMKHIQLSALKVGNGCSGSFVSPQGLVMTNHHCSTGCLEELSSPQRDLFRNGYLASDHGAELRCTTMEFSQLLEIEDVTARVQDATRGLSDQQFGHALKAEISKIEKACADATKLRCEVVTLYHGGRYHLYKYRRYTDVRLVFAPEAQMAQFGGDPDNFNFPRYAMDVTFFRVYDHDKPVPTPNYLSFSQRGVADGDLVFAAGHPGSTQRLLTVAQLEFLRDVQLPGRLLYIAELRGQLTQFGKRGPDQKRMVAEELYFLENSYKALLGQEQALLDRNFIAAKRASEQALRAQVAKNPQWQKQYGAAWDALAKAQDDSRKYFEQYNLLEKMRGFNSQLFGYARTLVRSVDERKKPSEERLREFRDSALPVLTSRLLAHHQFYPQLDELTLTYSLTKLREALGPDHPLIKDIFSQYSPEEIAHNLVTNSHLGESAVRKQLWDGGAAAITASSDPMIKFARAVDEASRKVRKQYEDEIESVIDKNAELVAQALFAVQGTSIYPDATASLRLTYGQVRGFADPWREVPAMTTLRGAFERHTGREPFILPQSWLAAKSRLKLDTPFNFVSTLDIIGGNSGSPAFGKDGQVVGVVFDGNLHSLGGAYYFDDAVNRSITVHSAGMLEALRVVYNAATLVKELTTKP
jgi:hypothetical protein